jgi:hypothetical protein
MCPEELYIVHQVSLMYQCYVIYHIYTNLVCLRSNLMYILINDLQCLEMLNDNILVLILNNRGHLNYILLQHSKYLNCNWTLEISHFIDHKPHKKTGIFC